MKPLFTIHEGEFLVGDYINRNLGKKFEVWVPTRDTGVDLLVTRRRNPQRCVRIQVKHSRSYDRYNLAERLLARGWYTLNHAKIRKSPADIWIFTVLTLRHDCYFVVVPTRELKRRIPKRLRSPWHMYLTVLQGDGGKDDHRCYDTRKIKQSEAKKLLVSPPTDLLLDYTEYLSNWAVLDQTARS